MGSYSDYEFYCDIKMRKGKGILVNDGQKDIWLPVSQIRKEIPPEPNKKNGATKLIIPEWLAIRAGIA